MVQQDSHRFDTDELAGLLGDFGARWAIGFDDEVMAWIAVRHPSPTAQHVLAAHDLGALRARLRKAENAG